ncbi:NADH:ubiquinone oxidoreductase complex I intermediate-associated protein 30 [Hyella patelloides LEGE 07179]|uniref:NADH:ubiquinone oxidoreductase complex I intermediate-associated protein 30 n=1 Tax=Hyella patelloides LEGE 07179 TaxID=945734 RepID=A0A563VTR9_9CYAN|nr:CIA30 family protein [Hyella patelloides]VEP14784.1 NADH:ubiquinone oxidoreductase complex I intermediate-associated protein 30 [Hyella patelloides LEGE 07179]
MKTILVLGINNNLGHQVVSYLLKNHYHIQILATEANYIDLTESSSISPIDLDVADSLKPEYFSQIEHIIICLEANSNSQNEPNYGNTIFTFNQLTKLIQATAYLPNSTEKILFNFTEPNLNLKSMWGAVDDVVMGGVSQSSFNLAYRQGIFSGYVSTDNNGGFASVRTRNFDSPLDLSDYQGIELRVKGDGKRYKFITRCEGQWDGVSYCYSFDTVYNIPITVRIPFNQLRPVFRAKTVKEAGQFDSSKLYSLQLMLSKFEYDGELNSKFEPGNFRLTIESIKAYGSSAKPQLIVVNSDADYSLEKTVQNANCDYAIIRRKAIAEKPADKVFNDTLVPLTVKSLESPEAINQIWLSQT